MNERWHERVGGALCQDHQVALINESSSESEDLMKADHYDSFAESYSTENESSLLNAYYERPAMIDLAGDVNGRRVLDAGCGSGLLSAALRAKGAIVTGFDSSSAMVELARQRLGEKRCTWPTSASHFHSPTVRSMTSWHPSFCTTCGTGPPCPGRGLRPARSAPQPTAAGRAGRPTPSLAG